jgi:hypothetical protein
MYTSPPADNVIERAGLPIFWGEASQASAFFRGGDHRLRWRPSHTLTGIVRVRERLQVPCRSHLRYIGDTPFF